MIYIPDVVESFYFTRVQWSFPTRNQ